MSLFGALNSATAGLRMIQTHVKLVSDNVAQADDPDRTRHTMRRTTDSTGSSILASFSRQTDTALRIKLEESTARDGGDSTRNVYMKKVSDLLGASQGSPQISELAQKFADAWRQLETTPENDTAQREVIQLGDRLATEIKRVAGEVESLDNDIRENTANSIDELNRLTTELEKINADIAYVNTRGEPTEDLLDKRDALVKQINEMVGVRTMERSDGRISVFTTSGLTLVDVTATQLRYDGQNITVPNAPELPVNNQIRDGKISALLEMRYDGSKLNPPQPASGRPTAEIIRKLRGQLDTLAQAYTAPAKDGQPTSFAQAYDQAATKDGELQYQFFSGGDRFSLSVAHELVTGTAKIKKDGIKAAADAILDTGRQFKTDGLAVSEGSYATLANGIVGVWMSAGRSVSETASVSSETKALIETRHHNETGVNIDEEVAHLQVLQTSYAATARVVQTINAMFEALERAV
ncbi:flagellar hook-associated protein FlgK [Azospirillum sp.]|uniref:flagellar hook-associated protein FlgK n=1 Tax=Azospirillum sp. TaxID=34012 RepID=UPI002D4CD79F|nr:flagellar hook-associated protein FlgK [Azospirillum sp.]HYD66551.1 flagellar hook-associated protein FlgK [Azospirillum sp.]